MSGRGPGANRNIHIRVPKADRYRAFRLADILPAAVEEARRDIGKRHRQGRPVLTTDVCPVCAGPKSYRAKRCSACYKEARRVAKRSLIVQADLPPEGPLKEGRTR